MRARLQLPELFELRQAQQFVDQRLQTFALRLDVTGEALAFRRGKVVLAEKLRGAADGGERALHFVRHVLHVVFDVGAAVDLVAQLRERARQRADLVLALRRRFGRLAGRDLCEGIFGSITRRRVKGDRKAGIVVDNLIGQQEIVIKTLGKLLAGLKVISGATVLGDGRVALILDVSALM